MCRWVLAGLDLEGIGGAEQVVVDCVDGFRGMSRSAVCHDERDEVGLVMHECGLPWEGDA